MIVNSWVKYQNHIESLCRKHGIILWTGAQYSREFDTVVYEAYIHGVKRIRVSDINCMELYLAALHEIGHCVDKRAQYSLISFWPHDTVYGEFYAWEFAIKNSRLPIGDSDYQYMANCLRNYISQVSSVYRRWKKPRAKNYKVICSYL